MSTNSRLQKLEERAGQPDNPEPVTYIVDRGKLRQVVRGLVDCGAVSITRDGVPVDILEAELDGGMTQIVERMSATGKDVTACN